MQKFIRAFKALSGASKVMVLSLGSLVTMGNTILVTQYIIPGIQEWTSGQESTSLSNSSHVLGAQLPPAPQVGQQASQDKSSTSKQASSASQGQSTLVAGPIVTPFEQPLPSLLNQELFESNVGDFDPSQTNPIVQPIPSPEKAPLGPSPEPITTQTPEETSLAPEVTQTPSPSSPSSQEPVRQEPSSQEPETQAETTQEVATQLPESLEPETVEPSSEEALTEGPVPEEPVTEEPITEEPVTEEPVTEEPVTEEPVTEEPKPTYGTLYVEVSWLGTFELPVRYENGLTNVLSYPEELIPILQNYPGISLDPAGMEVNLPE